MVANKMPFSLTVSYIKQWQLQTLHERVTTGILVHVQVRTLKAYQTKKKKKKKKKIKPRKVEQQIKPNKALTFQ